jgi:hypothetical protein
VGGCATIETTRSANGSTTGPNASSAAAMRRRATPVRTLDELARKLGHRVRSKYPQEDGHRLQVLAGRSVVEHELDE